MLGHCNKTRCISLGFRYRSCASPVHLPDAFDCEKRCMRFAPFLGIASMATTTTMQILVQPPCLPSQEVGTVGKLKVSASFPKIQVL